MTHVAMRKLAPAAQAERRRQVIGRREHGLTYGAPAARDLLLARSRPELTRNGISHMPRLSMLPNRVHSVLHRPTARYAA